MNKILENLFNVYALCYEEPFAWRPEIKKEEEGIYLDGQYLLKDQLINSCYVVPVNEEIVLDGEEYKLVIHLCWSDEHDHPEIESITKMEYSRKVNIAAISEENKK